MLYIVIPLVFVAGFIGGFAAMYRYVGETLAEVERELYNKSKRLGYWQTPEDLLHDLKRIILKE